MSTVRIDSVAGLLEAIALVRARTPQPGEAGQLRAAAALLQALQQGAVEVRIEPTGETAITASSDPPPPAALLEFARLLEAAARQSEQLASTRALTASLEMELEETNRGVMALYAELDDRADKLRKADDLKSRFLSYASHELRTPLNGIIGLVRLLRSSPNLRSDDDFKQLSFIQRAAEEMREMVNDLLDLAKVEAGKVEVQPSEFDLGFVFGALRGIFRPLLHSEAVTLIFEDTSAVPAIYSDEGKVSQILRNLLSNAVKFTERGTVRVSARHQGANVQIFVSDTGIGIPADQLVRIFDAYSQVDNPLQRRVRGTGLGLPLCRHLAELLGGELSVRSEPGKGSVFTLTLPREYAVRSNEGSPAAPGLEIPGPARKTALLIDDVEIDRYLLSRLITAAGDFDIIQADDGPSGIDVARREQPDVIFLDLNLPGLDGFAVASALAAEPLTRAIPVFIVTAQQLDEAQIDTLRKTTRSVFFKDDLSQAQRVQIDLSGAAPMVWME